MFAMKKLVLFLLIAVLAGCTRVGDKQTNTILTLAAPTSLGTLEGKTTVEIAEILGKPAFIRTEAPHQTWGYKAPDCALFVFFNKDGVSCYTETKGSCDKQVARRLLAQQSTI